MKRAALVIGNAAYSDQPLTNPGNDAEDMAGTLRKYGFVVHKAVDSTYLEMERALKDFRAELYDADVGLFFFAGHGVQVEGSNYLIALDTDMSSELDAKHTSLKLDKVIDVMEKANTSTSIIILDACRDNPWERRWHRSAAVQGLASVYAPRGTLIAFATSPGQIAGDGKGRRNGSYTEALLQHIGTADCAIESMFKRVRNTLSAATDGKQVSWEHTSLAGEFFFNLSVGARIDHYSPTSLRDSALELDNTKRSHQLIRGLKSHDWPTQNKALSDFNPTVAASFSNDNLFVVGRNIYQAACGEAHGAISFIDKFTTRTSGLDPGRRKALLDGMLFEIFFNKEAQLRDEPKVKRFNPIFDLQKHASLSTSFDFIVECLLPYADRFYALPGKSDQLVIDIVLGPAEVSDKPRAVKKVCIASQDVLRPDDWEIDSDEEPKFFSHLQRESFEEQVSKQLAVPLWRLSFTYTGSKKLPDQVRFPLGWTVQKRAE